MCLICHGNFTRPVYDEIRVEDCENITEISNITSNIKYLWCRSLPNLKRIENLPNLEIIQVLECPNLLTIKDIPNCCVMTCYKCSKLVEIGQCGYNLMYAIDSCPVLYKIPQTTHLGHVGDCQFIGELKGYNPYRIISLMRGQRRLKNLTGRKTSLVHNMISEKLCKDIAVQYFPVVESYKKKISFSDLYSNIFGTELRVGIERKRELVENLKHHYKDLKLLVFVTSVIGILLGSREPTLFLKLVTVIHITCVTHAEIFLLSWIYSYKSIGSF